MIQIYILLVLGACSCPSNFIYGTLNTTTLAVNNANVHVDSYEKPSPQCGASDVRFTQSEETANAALEQGARVFELRVKPFAIASEDRVAIGELKREAKTTYSVKSDPVEVK